MSPRRGSQARSNRRISDASRAVRATAGSPSNAAPSPAQRVNLHSNTARGGVDVKQVAGRKVGNVTTRGNIILLELDAAAVTPHNLFDLDRRTIRFTPAGAGYRAETLSLQWDTARGSALCSESRDDDDAHWPQPVNPRCHATSLYANA